MKITSMEIGICETCKSYYEDHYDPSPSGVSLSPGYMIDAGCKRDDELAEKYPNMDGIGKDIDNQCPLWELTSALAYCMKHKYWYWSECTDCYDDYIKSMEDFKP